MQDSVTSTQTDPKDQEFNGKFRQINLDCGKLKIDTRKGYYAIPEGDTRD